MSMCAWERFISQNGNDTILKKWAEKKKNRSISEIAEHKDEENPVGQQIN